MEVEQWPIDIGDNENIVRGICSPYHVSTSGKLKPEAYDPTPRTDEVSVMRSDLMSSYSCKERAKMLENLQRQKIYRGLAVLSAGSIRQESAAVIDLREHNFLGHADIKHGFTVIAGEPPAPEIVRMMRERNKRLAAIANYHLDPDPSNHC